MGVLMTPKTGLTQPIVQEVTTETVDDRANSFGDYWIVANRPHFAQVPPRRLSLARMENPLPWVRPGSEGLITSPARLLCANAGTRSLWLTCKQADGSRHIVPFRSRCGGTPTITSLLGGRACQRPSIMSVEGRRVILPERRLVERTPPARVVVPTAAPPPVMDVPVARVEQPPTRAQAPPVAVASRNAEWPASALLMLAIAAIIMALLVGVIVHLYHGKKTVEDEKESAEATIFAMQESARQRTAQTRATLLEVHSAREADREQVRTKIAPAAFGLAARLKKLEEQHAQAESHRDKLLGEVHTLNARIQDLEQENAALLNQAQPTAIVGDSEEVARLRHALADAEARLTVLTSHVEELENRKARDDSTLAETLVHLASVEEELEKARAKEQDLLTQIAELRIQLEARQEPTEKLFPPKPSDPPPVMTDSRPPGDGHPSLGVPREPTPARGSSDGRQRRSTIPGPGGSPEPDDGFKSFDDGGPEEPTAVQEVPRPRAANPPGTVPSVPPAQHISGVHPKPATGS
ncbi:hypothetical protein KBD13_01790 [Patescibacteria group bacterium]|nr:hypothetical protein [Patescibacteria group bacterium]